MSRASRTSADGDGHLRLVGPAVKNFIVTDRSIERTMGVWKPGTGGDVRQPPGLAAADEVTVAMWDDTRHGTP